MHLPRVAYLFWATLVALAIGLWFVIPATDEATALKQQASALFQQSRYAEAEPLNRRVLAIAEKALGPDHPDVAQSLNNLAVIYQMQGRYAEAEPLLKRALAIQKAALGPDPLGPDHYDLAQSLNNLALIYQMQGRHAEAEPLFEHALRSLRRLSTPTIPPSPRA